MDKIIQKAVTFDDVLLIPGHSTVLPKDVNLSTQITQSIQLNTPILSAAMDTVTEFPMAIAIAQEGGLGIIHKNMSIENQARHVKKVKKYESGIVKDPITATPDLSIRELLDITEKYHFSGVPVVLTPRGDELMGIVTSRDVRFATDLSQPISTVMTPKDKLITVLEGAAHSEVKTLLHQHRIEKVLVVNKNFKLRGLMTVRDIQKSRANPLASKDSEGRLIVGAAVGTGADTHSRVEALAQANVDVIVVDTAHGHSQGVLNTVEWIKNRFPNINIIGGNIATAAAARDLISAGADAVKVGIGPGSICTTRIVAGVGVPQLTAINNVYQETQKYNVGLIADGGIRFSGDIAKAIAAGADCVMIGSLFAGTEEAPGEIELYQGRSYKSYRGMGSLGAMSKGSSDRYFQTGVQSEKLVPEGVEGRVPYKGQMNAVLHQLTGGLRASMGYTGQSTILDMKQSAQFVEISGAGMSESHAHDIHITKTPPNYQSR